MDLKKCIKSVLLFAVILLLTGCLGKSDAPVQLWRWDDIQKNWLYDEVFYTPNSTENRDTVWIKQANAVTLHVETLKSLTNFDNASQALQIRIFQLTDSGAFLQAAQSSNSVKHLFVASPSEVASVGVESVIVLPGESQTLSFERQAKARYIGLILGYAKATPDKVFRLVPIVTTDAHHPKEEQRGLLAFFTRLFKRWTHSEKSQTPAQPVSLEMKLLLEAAGINKLDVPDNKGISSFSLVLF
jgi:predicted component of type VI protein secretion system